MRENTKRLQDYGGNDEEGETTSGRCEEQCA